jgi:trimeric autotransporter adhesin
MKRKMETLLSANRHLKALTAPTLLAMTLSMSAYAVDLPTGEDITHGDADIFRDSNSLTVDQHSSNLVINWNDFSIASGNTVNFLQQRSDIVLNRVVGDNPSNIFGSINAGGQVFLINQSGILFAPGARVDAAGLVASTLDMADADFLSGNYLFEGAGGDVINQGSLVAADGGYVALFGRQAINEGIISARLGSVALASGDRIAMDFTGDGLIRLEVDSAVVDGLVSNHNLIFAEGGRVYMTASAAGDLAATVVNNEGIIEATGVEERDGQVFLTAVGGSIMQQGSISVSGLDGTNADGGLVKIHADGNLIHGTDSQIHADGAGTGNGGDIITWASGTNAFNGGAFLSATGGELAGDGGFIDVSGENVFIAGRVDLSAANGAAGTMLIDPRTIEIIIPDTSDLGSVVVEVWTPDVPGENQISTATIASFLATGNLILQATDRIFGESGAVVTGGGVGNTLTMQLYDSYVGPGAREINLTGVTIDLGGDTLVLDSKTAITDAIVGNITIGAIDSVADLSVMSSGDITVNGAVVSAAGANLMADSNIVVNADITTTGDLVLNSDRDANLDGHIFVGGAALSSNGGNIVLGGGSDPNTERAYGNLVRSPGIWINATSSLDSAGGNISLLGASDDVASGAQWGVYVQGDVNSGAGTILIDGVSRGTGISNAQGVSIVGSNTIQSSNSTASAITITGITQPGANTHTAMGVNLAADVLATGGGGITITGTGGTTSPAQFSQGILLQLGAEVLANSGDITLTGIAPTADGSSVQFSGTSYVGAHAGGVITASTSDIAIYGDKLSISANDRFQSSGTLLFAPTTASGTIGVAGAAGTMQLLASYFTNNFVDGFSQISIGDANTGVIRVNALGAANINDALLFRTGSNLFFDGIINIDENITAYTGDSIVVDAAMTTTGDLDFNALNGVQVLAAVSANNINVIADADLSAVENFSPALVPDGIGTVLFGAGGSLSGVDVVVVSGSALALGDITATGTLAATATTGGITDSGTLSVTGDVTLNDVALVGITLDTLAADSNVIITAGGDTAITNDTALNLEGTVTGTLDATATTGGITDSGTLSVTGDVTLNDVALVGITLDTLAADSNVIITAGGDTAITNDTALNLEGTVTGTLAATATTGGITDSGTLSVTGDVTLNDVALVGITLDTLAADSNVIITAGGDTAITNDTALNLEGTVTGTLAATATTGGITDSGTLSVTGDVTLNDVALVGITLDTLAADSNVIITAGGDTAITNDTALNLEGTVTGTLAATATTGGITDSGTLSVTGDVTLNDVALVGITLDTLAADSNVIITAGGDTAITNDTALNLEGTVTGTLDATATTGGITDSGTLSVTGDVTLNDVALVGITLDTLAADSNVIITAGGDTAITNDTALNLEGTVTGTLAATATTGGITDSGILSVSGNATFTDSANAGITLDTLQADGNVIISGGDTAITNDTALNLEGTVTGTLDATATTGGITDSGILSVSGNATLTDVRWRASRWIRCRRMAT